MAARRRPGRPAARAARSRRTALRAPTAAQPAGSARRPATASPRVPILDCAVVLDAPAQRDASSAHEGEPCRGSRGCALRARQRALRHGNGVAHARRLGLAALDSSRRRSRVAAESNGVRSSHGVPTANAARLCDGRRACGENQRTRWASGTSSRSWLTSSKSGPRQQRSDHFVENRHIRLRPRCTVLRGPAARRDRDPASRRKCSGGAIRL